MLSKKEAYHKAQAYCAYQERCEYEVQQKLQQWGTNTQDAHDIIDLLKQERFVDNKRFAALFAKNKFRLKGWGKQKIQQHLQHKKIAPLLIETALSAIDMHNYNEQLNVLLHKKAATLREADAFKRQQKLARFLLQKGYESSLVWMAIRQYEATIQE